MNKAIIIISKIIEVFHWVGCGFLVVFTIALAIGKEELIYKLSSIENLSTATDVEMYGFSIDPSNSPQLIGAYILFFIAGAFICAMMAMVFRYVHLVFKTAAGETKFSEGNTPFQPVIVKMIRRIGWLCIAVPAFELVISIIATIAFGGVESSVQLGIVFFGLIVLALSRFFAYGVELQKDTEGLV